MLRIFSFVKSLVHINYYLIIAAVTMADLGSIGPLANLTISKPEEVSCKAEL